MLKKISANVLLYGGLNAAKSLIPILMLPILTAQLTIDEFGSLALIDSVILFLVPLVMMGISSGVSVNYHKLSAVQFPLYVTNAILIALGAFIILTLLAIFFKNSLNDFFDFNGNMVIYLAFFAILRVYNSTILALLQTSQATKIYAGLVIFQSLLDVVISYVLVVLCSQGIFGRLFGIYFAFTLTLIAGFVYLRRKKYIGAASLSFSGEIFSFGLPLIPHTIGAALMAMADRFFIASYLGNAHVAGYVVAYQMAAVMLLVGTSINQAWTPVYFAMMKTQSYNKIKQSKLGLMLLMLAAGISVYFLMDVLFSLFVDEKFWFAKEFFPFMLLGFIFQSLYFIYTNYFFYTEQTRIIASLTILGAIINLGLNCVLIESHGVMGAAYANAITWAFFLFSVIFATKLCKGKR